MGLVTRRAAMFLGSVAVMAVSGQAGFAQDANANRTNFTWLEKLVVGAGTEKIAIDTPQSVTVLDQEALDALQATTTGQIFESVPGVTMVGSGRVLGEAFNIRGIGVTENSADAARIIVNVDGVPKFNEQYRMGSFFSDPELYKRVEVLRGPASSTLYGAGALGGVINFQTKDASDFILDGDTGAVRLKTTYDSNGNGTLVSGVFAHRINETFDILATGNWRRADDYTFANGTTANGSTFNALSGLIKGTARFGQNNEEVVRLSYQHWNSGADGQYYVQTSTQPVNAPAGSDFGLIDRTVVDKTAVLSYENPASDNPWLDLNVSLSFSDTSNSQANSTSPLLPAVTPTIRILDDTTYIYRTYQLKADNTIEYIGEDFENYFTFGLQASHQDRLAERTLPTLLLQHPEGVENKLGLFAQNEFVWDDRLTLIAGLRTDFSAISPSSAIPGSRDISAHAVSPKIAALYDVTDNIGIFGSIAYTERLPTIDELYSVANNGTGMNLDLRKESSINYEAGFTLSGYDVAQLNDTASLKATAFYNDLHDMIATSGTRAGSAFPVGLYAANIDRARIYGIEIEGAYNSDYLFANAAYTATWGYELSNGTPLRTIPAHRLALTVGARLPEHNLEFGARANFVADSENSVNASPTASMAGPARPVAPVAGYQTYDLFASWKPDTGAFAGTELQLGIENLFNADYQSNLSSDRSRGTTFKVSLSRQFGY